MTYGEYLKMRLNSYVADPCPKCLGKVREISTMPHPTEFLTMIYVYQCVKCGFILKKTVNKYIEKIEYKEIKF